MTSASLRAPDHRAAASVAAQRAVRILLATQEQGGWWPDRTAGGASLAAEVLLLRWFRRAGAAAGQEVTALIRSGQRADGSWAGAEPGPTADLSASVLCYLALALAGDSPDAYHMAAAAGWIRDAGGTDAVGVPTRAWLALLGLSAWADVPVPVPEALWFPAREPRACSRVVAVTLAILGAQRPVRAAGLELAELRTTARAAAAGASLRPAGALAAARSATRSAARPAALRACGTFLTGWQQAADGDGQRPRWPLSLIALHVLGYRSSDPQLAAGPPPVAQTARAVHALRAAGLPADHPSVAAAARWLLRRRIGLPPSGAGTRGEAAPCGWSFCPDGYPRTADTALVLQCLSGIEPASSTVNAAAARWLAGTQDRDGGWDSSAELTGYCVRALARFAVLDPDAARAIRSGVVWLLRAQRSAGDWPGRGGNSDLRATSVVLPALLSAGVRPGKPCITGGVGWLLGQQNADGGWPLCGGAGPPGAECSDETGTSLVLTALQAASRSPAGNSSAGVGVSAAASWLVRAQLADGTWAGSMDGIPRPLAALGQYVAGGASPGLPGNLAVGIQDPPRNFPDHQYRPLR